MDEVAATRQPLVVTKRGKPVVKLFPADQELKSTFGALKGTVQFHSDVVAPIDVAWEADA